jgi:prepilin peptidase CpaA
MIVTGFTYALTLAMAGVIWLDITRYLIPNSLNFAILMLWAAGAYFLYPALPPVLLALLTGVLILAVGLGFFALGLMGGGDIKLLAVLSLWTGWGMATLQFLFYTAFVGGVLVIAMLCLRALAPALTKRQLPRFLTKKQPVPYGLAIAGAFLLMLWQGQVPILAH